MKIHDLQARRRARTKGRKRVGRGIGGKGGKTAGRGTKGQKARGTIPVGFEGGQLPLHMRVPKLKGFNNPFRVEYQAINLDILEATGLDEVTPETLHGQGPHPQGRARQGARPGRAHPRRHGARPTRFSKSAEAAITAAGGTVEVLPLPWGDRRPPRQGQPAHQPLASAGPSGPRSTGPIRSQPVLSSLRNIFKVPDLRNKILFTLLMLALYRFGRLHPGARASTSAPSRRCKDQADAGRRARPSCSSSPAARSPSSPSSRSGSCRTSRRRSSCRSSPW